MCDWIGYIVRADFAARSRERQQRAAMTPAQRDAIIPTGHEAYVAGGLQGLAGLGRRFVAGLFARGAGAVAGETALFNGGRDALRTALADGIEGITEGQASNLTRAMGRGAVDNIAITAGENGAITVQMTRAGRNGYQVLTKTINADGRTTTMAQSAYNSAGEIVHGEVWK